jgi:hypothetical protein
MGGSVWAVNFVALIYDKIASAAWLHLTASVAIS